VQETAEMLFQHLCALIDNPNVDHKSKAYRLAEQLIIDGMTVLSMLVAI
jgi:hypothetical protein